MAHANKQTIYLISGPCGVGKSTVSKEVSHLLQHAVLIHGDEINHMFEKGFAPPRDERLALSWTNILCLTRNFVQHGYSVVIDFVVEEELEWFCEQTADLDADLRYVVLRADEDTIIERINRRGDPEIIDRSLFLLNKLENSPANQQFIYDTTHSAPTEIAQDIILLSRFAISRP